MTRKGLTGEPPVTRLVAKVAAVAVILVGSLGFMATGGAQEGPYPEIVPVTETSAQDCASLAVILGTAGYEVPETWTQAKIDPPVDGTDGVFTVLNMDNTDGDPSFDWTSTQPINIVFVKSGEGASQIYYYDPATGATSGTGLTTANGKQISNIVACYGTFTPDDTTTTTTTTQTTPPPDTEGATAAPAEVQGVTAARAAAATPRFTG